MSKPMSLIDEPGIKQLMSIAADAPVGNFVEVGVYRGGSAWYLNELCISRGCSLYLFDTFEGMPFRGDLDVVPVGHFAASYEKVCRDIPKAHIFKGIFPETLPKSLSGIAFAHIDCDQQKSVENSIIALKPRLVPGGILYIDDYENMPGVKKAVESNLEGFDVVIGGRALWFNW